MIAVTPSTGIGSCRRRSSTMSASPTLDCSGATGAMRSADTSRAADPPAAEGADTGPAGDVDTTGAAAAGGRGLPDSYWKASHASQKIDTESTHGAMADAAADTIDARRRTTIIAGSPPSRR